MRDVNGVARVVAEDKILEFEPAVGMRIRAHAPISGWRQFLQFGHQAAAIVEELVRTVRPHPGFELLEMGWIPLRVRNRYLVRPPRTLHALAVDDLRPRPSFRRAQHDCRPARSLHHPRRPRRVLDRPDARVTAVQDDGERAMHRKRIIAGHFVHVIPVRVQQHAHVGIRSATQHRRSRDLVLVQVQDGQHRPVARRIEETHPLPRALERSRLGLAVADHTGHEQVGIVERRAERVDERVAQFPSLMDRSRRGHTDVTRNPSGG